MTKLRYRVQFAAVWIGGTVAYWWALELLQQGYYWAAVFVFAVAATAQWHFQMALIAYRNRRLYRARLRERYRGHQ